VVVVEHRDRLAREESVGLVTRTLGTAPIGALQLQAAIAAVHDEAPSAEETNWPQILALYEVLERVSPGSLGEPPGTPGSSVPLARGWVRGGGGRTSGGGARGLVPPVCDLQLGSGDLAEQPLGHLVGDPILDGVSHEDFAAYSPSRPTGTA
jgi:hypothetical protein